MAVRIAAFSQQRYIVYLFTRNALRITSIRFNYKKTSFLIVSIPNILAERYASSSMAFLWSPENRVVLERRFWIAVLKAQRDLGLAISDDAIRSYEKNVENVDLASIRAREEKTKHDVKARIEEFCALAGHEDIHKGMTSRDLTENIEQYQILESLKLTRIKAVSVLTLLAQKAEVHQDTIITARSHNVPAQLTTLGKRFAMYGEELIRSISRLDHLIEGYSFRGVKGAVGTQLDLLRLFNDDAQKVKQFEEKLTAHLRAVKTLTNVGQIYPRSLDYEVVSALLQLSAAPANFATTMRLMAGQNLVSEGFAKGQTGSSAMPHKVNARSCERINGFCALLKGSATTAAEVMGNQWNEGDVSCSVARRVFLPDSFFTIDGILETFMAVLRQMEVYEAQIARENEQNLPWLMTTQVLMQAIKKGVGRETAHELIKKHALAARKSMLEESAPSDIFIQYLKSEKELLLTASEIDAIYEDAKASVGLAKAQVNAFIKESKSWQSRFPESKNVLFEQVL